MATVVISLTNKNDHRISTELSQPELAAIGRVTVVWAELEHELLSSTLDWAEAAGVALPPDTFSLSFKKRLRTARTLVKSTMNGGAEKDTLLALLTAVGGCERSRNRITHGLWDWVPDKPEATQATSYRPPHEFTEPFDFRKLIDLGRRIGKLCFQLRYPGGEDQFLEEASAEMQGRGVSGSRWFALFAGGSDPANPHLPPASPPKRPEPR
jgi:hypothetical protein